MLDFKIYFERQDRHDATIYYVGIIKQALLKLSSKVEYVDSLDLINRDSIVVVVNAKAHLKVLLRNRKQKVICWYQGIMPEELKVNYNKKDKILKIILWTFFEYLSLRCVSFPIFVSTRMRKHYEEKYKIKFGNFYIMPCFNQELNKEAFFIADKYKKPTFMYAGTMSKWQCVDEMLSIYQTIEKTVDKASMTIFTPDKVKAQEYILKYGLKRVGVDYLPFDKLSEAIQKFKYGFIIREDIEMNRVATPTKMNTYLSNGIIPIYNDVIYAFKEGLASLKFKVVINKGESEIKEKIRIIEAENINPDDIFEDFKTNAFKSFYSSTFHINSLSQMLMKIF